MDEFTFLTNEQVTSLNILNIYGRKCAITDFSRLLGGYIVPNYNFSKEGVSFKNMTSSWWLRSNGKEHASCVDNNGAISWCGIFKRTLGARPVVKYSSIKHKTINKRINDDVIEVDYGEYPQWVIDKDFSETLEKEYKNNNLILTQKEYSTDSVYWADSKEKLKIRTFKEYEYKGNKYIRFVADKNAYNTLSDGRIIKEEDVYWLKVDPVTWLIDEKEDIAISKYILFAGVQFDTKFAYDGIFNKTNIFNYMNTYFAKDIIPSIKINNIEYNPYNFDFKQKDEEEIIRGYIKSDIAVFIHGKSGDGKSDRVKKIDNDYTILYLGNISVENINGICVFNESTKDMMNVKPTWLIKLEEKCEKEPDKLHILFLDELTNAHPKVQNIIFNMVLNKEVNGLWELPKNARIIASGNELEESLTTNEISEPLFGRFAHVYINSTVEKWLEWANDNNIHPSIVAYIAYKKDDVLRSKYDGLKPNADPRKWEMASKVLYKTNMPEIIRGLVGEDITKDFIAFTKSKVITLDDILNDNYNIDDMNISEKYMTTIGLLDVNKDNYDKVIEFISKLGKEFSTLYESLYENHNNRKNNRIKLKMKKYKMTFLIFMIILFII